jgi:hypothetical protein
MDSTNDTPGAIISQRLSQQRHQRQQSQQPHAALVNLNLSLEGGEAAPIETIAELHAQLNEFYATRDTSKIPQVEKLLSDYPFDQIVQSLLQKYGELPAGWEKYAQATPKWPGRGGRKQQQFSRQRQQHRASMGRASTTAIAAAAPGAGRRIAGDGGGGGGLPSLLVGSTKASTAGGLLRLDRR